MKIRIKRTNLLSTVMMCAGLFLLRPASSAQNLFVADYDGFNGIYQITPGASQSIFSPVSAGSFILAFNSAGNLFVADADNGEIYEFTNQNGSLNPNSGVFVSGLHSPYGLAFNAEGNLFEADFGSDDIYVFTNYNGTLMANPTLFATNGLNGPIGLAFDNAGDLFEADYNSGKIYEFTNYNGILASNLNVFASGLSSPAALAFDNASNLYVANDVTTGSITKITPAGSKSTFSPGALIEPWGLAFNSAGNLFVANQGASTIVEITPGGTQSNFFSEASDYYPAGLAFQPVPTLQGLATGNHFHLTISAPSPHFSVIVQASTNLLNWASVETNIPPFTYTDTISSTNLRHFYRTLLGH